jgi:hypothetical protein
MPSYPFNFAGINAKERSSQFLELSHQLLFQDVGVTFGVADCHQPLDLAACILFFFCSYHNRSPRERFRMVDIDIIRAEIERMRRQVQRQRGEIRQLQRAGIPTGSAEALLDRMLNKIDDLCAERDRLNKVQPGHNKGKALGGRQW